jgi:hypothetical protein
MTDSHVIGETYYTQAGEKVYLDAITTDGKLVVSQIMRYTDYGDDFYEDIGPSKIVDKLFAEAPVGVLDKRFFEAEQRLAEIETRYQARYSEVINAEREINARLAKLAKYRGLDNLEAFIDGHITHAVLTSEDYKIKTLSDLEEMDYGRKLGVPLISLHGNSKGDLTWQINRYTDGSGSWSTFIPCSSEEDARQKRDAAVASDLQEHYTCLSEDRPYYFLKVFEVAQNLGLPIDTAISDRYRQLKTIDLEKRKQELQANLATAQANLDKLLDQYKAVEA